MNYMWMPELGYISDEQFAALPDEQKASISLRADLPMWAWRLMPDSAKAERQRLSDQGRAAYERYGGYGVGVQKPWSEAASAIRDMLPPVTLTPQQQYAAQSRQALEQYGPRLAAVLAPFSFEELYQTRYSPQTQAMLQQQLGLQAQPGVQPQLTPEQLQAVYSQSEWERLDPMEKARRLQEFQEFHQFGFMPSGFPAAPATPAPGQKYSTIQVTPPEYAGPLGGAVGNLWRTAMKWAPGSEGVGARRTYAQQKQYENEFANALSWQPASIFGVGSEVPEGQAARQQVMSEGWEALKPALTQMLGPETMQGSYRYMQEPTWESTVGGPNRMRNWATPSTSSSTRYTPRWG